MRVAELKAITRERGLRGYSRLRKAELIELLRNNQPSTRPPPIPTPRSPHTRPKGSHTRRPPRPNRPPSPPTSVRFRPNRPRQPELLRKLEERNLQPPPPAGCSESRGPRASAPTLKPYQLKPKRRKETFVEPPVEQAESPPTNPKKLKRMKKKLDELNRRIRHSEKRHNRLIHKQNSLRKVIDDLKHGSKSEVLGPARQAVCQCLTGLLRSVSKG